MGTAPYPPSIQRSFDLFPLQMKQVGRPSAPSGSSRAGARNCNRLAVCVSALPSPVDMAEFQSRSRRCRASALKSGMETPPPIQGLKGRFRRLIRLEHKGVSAPRAPTSKCSGPIDGPSHAMSRSGRSPIARTVASSMPPASPRQPACAAATTSPESSVSNTGKQSAVRIAQTLPGRRVNAASAVNAWSADGAASARRPRSHRSYLDPPP